MKGKCGKSALGKKSCECSGGVSEWECYCIGEKKGEK